MKKLVLSTICGILCLTLVGCSSNSDTQALKNLNTQVDRMSNTVSNMSSSALYDVTPSPYLAQPTQEQTSDRFDILLLSSRSKVQQHEALKQEVINRSAILKSALNQKYKLGKGKVNAITQLTNSVSKYASDLNNSNNTIKNATKAIAKNRKGDKINVDMLNALYTQLDNYLEERIVYYNNILNTFDQIELIIGTNSNQTSQEMEYWAYQNPATPPTYSNEKVNQGQSPSYNYYDYNQAKSSYNSNQENTPYNRDATTKIEEKKDNKFKKNIDTYQTPNYNKVNQPNTKNIQNNYTGNYNTNGNYTVNNPTYNGNNVNNPIYNGGNVNNPVYNGYGYYRNGYGFNPGRNTDTFYPRNKNIDTYRFNPAVNNGYTNNGVNNGIYGNTNNGVNNNSNGNTNNSTYRNTNNEYTNNGTYVNTNNGVNNYSNGNTNLNNNSCCNNENKTIAEEKDKKDTAEQKEIKKEKLNEPQISNSFEKPEKKSEKKNFRITHHQIERKTTSEKTRQII